MHLLASCVAVSVVTLVSTVNDFCVVEASFSVVSKCTVVKCEDVGLTSIVVTSFVLEV